MTGTIVVIVAAVCAAVWHELGLGRARRRDKYADLQPPEAP